MCDEEYEKTELPEEIKLYNAISISEDNIAIKRLNNKCIDCGLCKTICENREGIEDICEGNVCVYCGQCVQACPVGALQVKKDIDKFKKAILSSKKCIAYVAPAVKVSIGEAFQMENGSFVQGKLITALRKLGFSYVLDVSSSADLTIVEEAAELVRRIKTGGVLPMFTSCCPSWVKYAETFYPELLPNLSTCKSPISMQGAIVKEYFCQKNNLRESEIFTVAITPCTSKKYEVSREELPGTDIVLTAKEIVELIKEKEINFSALENGNFDNLMSEGSGAGLIFGTSGGVMEAALRTVYKILTDNNLDNNKLQFVPIRGIKNVKELSLDIEGTTINVAVVNQMSSALPLLEDVKKGKSKYHFIEIMNCLGGCIGGGGLPKIDNSKELDIKEKRMKSLYAKDNDKMVRMSHQNPDIVKIYNEFLVHPLSEKAEELLHTYYKNSPKDEEK